MSAQQNYITDLGQLQRYYQQGLMNSDDIAIFNEAKRLGSVPYNVCSGFPFKATELMKDLLVHIEARQEAAAKSKHNDGSTFRAGIGS
ncbi:hypothetical protein OAL97_04770 [Paracoccaceae bacterium]|nr:hypothetical protein [Paracoccaceae bacterium]